MMRPGRRPLAVAIPVLLVVGVSLSLLLSYGPRPRPADIETADLREIVSDTLGRGMSVAELMAANGFEAPQIHEITQVVRDFKRPRTFRPGVVVRFSSEAGGSPDRIHLQLNPDTTLHLSSSDSGWTGRLEVVPLVVDTVRLSGVIESSLWLARLGGDVDRLEEGGFEEFVYDLADVFAWKIDFTRDIQKGDGFRVAFEREVRPDGSVRSRRFLAIELSNRGHALSAIPYTRPGGRVAYFDAAGAALRGAFLRYPVPYRITSGFTKRRYHPVLKRYRPHQGTDYGAPQGTRVQATASGTVTRAGWWGGYGRVVELRHANDVRTRYGHLSGIASGVRPGKHVEQGQFIGRVGTTGLATGPHLHYEFLQHGRHRNPMAISLPATASLEAKYRDDFRRVRDEGLALLDGLSLPVVSDIAVAAGPAGSSTR
ncbi:MAG: M23 family metallopeptidase [Gemmatimonadales bacterium]|nr:MAG: M23 family metallopeptidase [Gemmatimonadales bacterium]